MVYFVTLLFAVSIFYIFNSIYAQESVIILTSAQGGVFDLITMTVNYLSVFVAVVLGFLVIYANSYFIKRRHKEFGVYLMLGMKQKDVSFILLIETLVIGIVALVFGLLIGVLGSQFMSILTAKIFEADLSVFQFIFAPKALVKTIVYFGVIFGVVALFNLLVISKVKVIQLLHSNRSNQKQKIPKFGLSVVLFILSIIILGIAYHMVLKNGLLNLSRELGISIILGSIGTVIFFFSVAGGLTQIIQKNKKVYFKNLNMFVFRQLSSKINTNFISISVVCISLLLTIGIFSLGYSLESTMSKILKESVPYALSIQANSQEVMDDLYHSINEAGLINDPSNKMGAVVYYDANLNDSPLLKEYASKNKAHIDVMGLSDYNQLRKIQGLKATTLPQGYYKMVESSEATKTLSHILLKNQVQISSQLLPLEETDHFFTTNEQVDLILVVEDAFLADYQPLEYNLNIIEKKSEKELVLNDFLKSVSQDEPTFKWLTKSDIYRSAITSKSLVSFIAIYLGLIFMLTSSAILSIQQLSEAADNQPRYELLQKLGASPKQISRALFTQIFIYFAMPMLLAIVHSFVGLKAASEVMLFYGESAAAQSVIIVGIGILIVYSIYFLITYFSSQRMIKESLNSTFQA